MEVAIIGGGFAGLATAYFLQEFEGVRVTIFEKASSRDRSASGVSSGLLHPYPGIMARRSAHAEEALAISKSLLRVAEAHTPQIVFSSAGILRKSLNAEQHSRLLAYAEKYRDVEQLMSSLFFIHAGITVHSQNYLSGLSSAIQKREGVFKFESVESLEDLREFDHIVIAAGFGIKNFEECAHLKVKFLKGQVIRLRGMPTSPVSCISKGYMACLGGDSTFDIGSTYERSFASVEPDLEHAKQLLSERLKEVKNAEILGCRAAVRVCPQNHYLPVAQKITERMSVFTGLGSRGLLYHGYFGRKLANQIAQNVVMS